MNDAIEQWNVGDLRVSIVPDDSYSAGDVRDGDMLTEIVTWRHDETGIGDRQATEAETEAALDAGWPAFVEYMREHEDALIVLPLSGMSHSGETVWVASAPGETSPFDTAGWDSGQWGFVLVRRAVAEEMGIPGTKDGMKLPYTTEPLDEGLQPEYIETLEQEAERQACNEVEEYNDALTGNVYGYVIEREVTWQRVKKGAHGGRILETRESAVEGGPMSVTYPTADDYRTEWETVDSVWGFVGSDLTDVKGEAQSAAEYLMRDKAPVPA